MYNIPEVLNWPTLVSSWIVQDLVVILLTILTVIFIVKHEKRPVPILLEIACFVLLYAGIYENLAGVMGWYQFGHSVIMLFGVPITVPLIEILFVYVGIRFGRALKIPTWTIPLLVGMFGVLCDLTLDPLAMTQVAIDGGQEIGRWTWFIGAQDVQIFNVPIYNFTGWLILCGYATVWILLGRWWYKKSGYKTWVGYAYPPLCLLAALATMVSPLSAFILWLGPFFQRGGWTEYLMLGLSFAMLAVLLAVWRGRMRKKLGWRKDYIIWLVFGGFYLSNIIFTVVGGEWRILLFSLPFILIHSAILVWGFSSRRIVAKSQK